MLDDVRSKHGAAYWNKQSMMKRCTNASTLFKTEDADAAKQALEQIERMRIAVANVSRRDDAALPDRRIKAGGLLRSIDVVQVQCKRPASGVAMSSI